MSDSNSKTSEQLGTVPYIFAGMAFIPLIGLLFGIIAIFWGLLSRKKGGKRVATIAIFGIAVTLAIYGTMYYLTTSERNETHDKLRTQLSQGTIDLLVPSIELYKTQFGHYPESLEALQSTLPNNSFVSIFDPRSGLHANEFQQFFYQRIDANHYYLRSLGPDKQAFTNDDLVPQVTPQAGGNMGLLLEQKTP